MTRTLRDIIHDEQACLHYINTGIIEAERREAKRFWPSFFTIVAIVIAVPIVLFYVI